MYIKAVLSFLHGWQKLQDEHSVALDEIKKIIDSVSIEEAYMSSSREHRIINYRLGQLNWKANLKIFHGKGTLRAYFLDFIKDKIGLEFSFGKSAFVLRNLFFKYPRFIRAGHIQIAVVIIPLTRMELPRNRPSSGVEDYKRLFDDIVDLHPFPVQYPFVILGVTDVFSEIQIEELTTELDTFLIETLGLSLDDMRTSTERERYDFKETLPRTRPVFHLASALANQPGGGVILLGVNNSGNIVGILRSELDELRKKLTSTIRSNCKPCPDFNILDFSDPSNPEKCVLAVHIRELERKPCVVDDKIYIRAGSETVPAGSDEIRRLVIRSLQ